MAKRGLALLAFASILAPPLAAADSAPLFFDKLDVDAEQVHSTQPGIGDASTRSFLTSNASRPGGGGGLFTLWGNSRLGIKGGFGTAFLGVWDTPFRQAYDRVDLFDGSHIASPAGLLGSIGTATTLPSAAQGFPAAVGGAAVASTNFQRRQKSSLQYWTPVLRDFQIKFAYSVDEPDNRTAAANPALWSAAAAYDREPAYLAMTYERHQDMKTLAGSNVAGVDNGARLIGALRLGAATLSLVYERLSFATAATAAMPVTAATARNAGSLSASYQLEKSKLAAIYTHAGDLTGTTGTGANQFSLRYGYALGQGAELYGQYTAIRNGPYGTYNFGDILSVATAAGARLSGFGVGMAYAF